MLRHLLNDLIVRNAKPDDDKSYRLADGDGLYLYVPTSGARAWQFRYCWYGRQQTATLGRVGVMTLAEAREAAQSSRKLLANGEHLTVAKRLTRVQRRANADNTFRAVAEEWVNVEAKRSHWTPGHKLRVASSLHLHLSDLDELPIGQITAPIVAPLLSKLDAAMPDMATKVRQRLRAIFDHGVEQGIIAGNPLPARRRHVNIQKRRMPAVLDEEGVGTILQAADRVEVSDGVKRAHLLLAFCAQRVGEVVGATWGEVDLDDALWSIPRDRMKRKDHQRGEHLVPIPPRLRVAMRQWKRADGDKAVYVCPSPADASHFITREAVEKFYRDTLGLAGKHSPHSWRSTFSTMARNAGKDSESVEAQLDHIVGTKVAAAYDRAKRLELRRTLMAWYERKLLALRNAAS